MGGEEGPRFVVVGDVFSDVVAVPRGPLRLDTDTPATIRPRPGGSSANTAAWLGVLGRRTDFVGVVGSDTGSYHEDALRDAGVEPRLRVEPGVATGTIVIWVEGDRRTMLTDRGANSLLRSELVTDELLSGASLLHTSGYGVTGSYGAEGSRDLIDRATERGVPVSLNSGALGAIADYGPERFLDAVAGTTVLVANLDEGRLLSGKEQPEAVAAALLERVPVVAITLSAEGSVVADRETGPLRVPAHHVRLLDPSGAGDAYSAGFLSDWVEHRDVVSAATLATFTAARAVVVHGARPPV